MIAPEPALDGRVVDKSEAIDGKTSRSICDAVGERLQQSLRPGSLGPSTYFQHLLDELRTREGKSRSGLPN
jgi:hypothetical protein